MAVILASRLNSACDRLYADFKKFGIYSVVTLVTMIRVAPEDRFSICRIGTKTKARACQEVDEIAQICGKESIGSGAMTVAVEGTEKQDRH